MNPNGVHKLKWRQWWRWASTVTVGPPLCVLHSLPPSFYDLRCALRSPLKVGCISFESEWEEGRETEGGWGVSRRKVRVGRGTFLGQFGILMLTKCLSGVDGKKNQGCIYQHPIFFMWVMVISTFQGQFLFFIRWVFLLRKWMSLYYLK